MSTEPQSGERIAKVLARAGVASRRDAERMIEAGRVAVNGRIIDSPALNVTGRDRIEVDGVPLQAAEPARLWLYHKPAGLVTSARDEKGRETVFDALPEGLPRVMSIGRLDLNSEGLLLLTNDGEIKRRLELPATGWLRKYRVRVKGTPDEAMVAPLKAGVVIEGERFQPMSVTIDRQQGANAWLTIGLREGKNREIRRAMEAVGLTVNRLLRVSYGPFRLGTLKPGEVEEVRGRVLREQLGLEAAEAEEEAPRKPGGRPGGRAAGKPGPRPGGKPGERPAGKAGGKPGAKPTGKAGGKPRADFDRPAPKGADRGGPRKGLGAAHQGSGTPRKGPGGGKGSAPKGRGR